jgi:hypothetical protein
MCDLKADTVGDYAIFLAVLTAAALDSPAGSKMNGVALTYGPILLGGAVALMYALLLAFCTSPRRLLTKFLIYRLSGIVAVQCIIFFKLYPDEGSIKMAIVSTVWCVMFRESHIVMRVSLIPMCTGCSISPSHCSSWPPFSTISFYILVTAAFRVRFHGIVVQLVSSAWGLMCVRLRSIAVCSNANLSFARGLMSREAHHISNCKSSVFSSTARCSNVGGRLCRPVLYICGRNSIDTSFNP